MNPTWSPLPSVVVPGNHDGVHLGHRALLDRARQRADASGLRVVALFFDPHPLRVLAPERAPTRITMPARRAELLKQLGADHVAVVPFDLDFSQQDPEGFVRQLLVGEHGARGVVIGPDFRFGHRRAGDVTQLRSLGAELGFDVETVDPVEWNGHPVSSTRIRRSIAEGRIGEANAMLARAHEVEGTVVRGDARGRTLGFPTANLHCDPVQLPGDGVYAVVARDPNGGDLLGGAASIGVRPTFEGVGRSFEVFLLEFEGDLYDTRLRIGVIERIRGEEKFDSVDALKAQMRRDAREARRVLENMDRELVRWI